MAGGGRWGQAGSKGGWGGGGRQGASRGKVGAGQAGAGVGAGQAGAGGHQKALRPARLLSMAEFQSNKRAFSRQKSGQ